MMHDDLFKHANDLEAFKKEMGNSLSIIQSLAFAKIIDDAWKIYENHLEEKKKELNLDKTKEES